MLYYLGKWTASSVFTDMKAVCFLFVFFATAFWEELLSFKLSVQVRSEFLLQQKQV